MSNCSSVRPRSWARVCETSTTFIPCHESFDEEEEIIRVPPSPLPLPLPAVQVGHSMGNLCSSRRVETYPRMHSRQKACPQGSVRATESSGISSMHIPHTNTRWTVWESLIRSAESTRSSLSNSLCKRRAYERPSSRSKGGAGGPPRVSSIVGGCLFL